MSQDDESRARIFISYRSGDTGPTASRLFSDLATIYGQGQLFIDHEQIQGGQNWPDRLRTEAAGVTVMLVLIGADWLRAQNPTTGDRRLNEPGDWVHEEIRLALEADATVIPVLVDEARALTPQDLRTVPALAPLARLQMVPLRRKDWKSDLERLQGLVDKAGVARLAASAVAASPAAPAERLLTELTEPVVPPHFRGRESQIARVLDAFQRGRPSALVAIGGSGKTAIAAKVAADRRAAGHTKVVWLALAGTSDVRIPQEWLANALGQSIRSEGGDEQRAARLRGLTANQSLLVVLDDVTSDTQLGALLPCIGSGNDVVITARQRFAAMSRFGVEVIEVEPLAVEDGTRMLMDLLGRSQPDPAALQEWEALATAVGNHPLSLEVLAGDLALQVGLRPSVYLRERISTGRWSDGEEILVRLRKSLIDSVAHSRSGYDAAFAALGAFEGSALSAEAVATVCGLDSIDAARSFMLELRRRLCVRGTPQGLYSLHPFATETARQMQAASTGAGQRDASTTRHISYYSHLLRQNGGYEWNIAHYPALIPEEREIIRAIDAAAQLADSLPPDAARTFARACATMTSLVSWYLHWRGHWDLRIRFCQRVTDWAERGTLRADQGSTNTIVGNLYVDTGWIHLHRDDLARARHCATRGKAWLSGTIDEVFADELRGQVALNAGDADEAIRLFTSVRDSTLTGSRSWLVFSYRLADARQAADQWAQSTALLDELMPYLEQPIAGDEAIHDVKGRILYRVALRQVGTGKSREALASARQAVDAFDTSGIIAPERRAALALLADLLTASGAVDECRALLTTARERAGAQGDFETLAEAERRLGMSVSEDSVHLTRGLADRA